MASGGTASSMVLVGELRGNVRHKKISRYKIIQVHIELPGFTGPEYLVFALALSMSKNDDELNEFIDEVTDGAYSLPCVEVIFKLVKQMQPW
jgi:hypothetical protein